MTISQDTKIRDLPLGRLTSRIAATLARQGLETYGDLVNYWETTGQIRLGNNIGLASEAVINDWLWKQPIGVPGARKGEQSITVMQGDIPLKSNSFSIATPGMSLPEKVAIATASVAYSMKEIAKEQFRRGAVVIEP